MNKGLTKIINPIIKFELVAGIVMILLSIFMNMNKSLFAFSVGIIVAAINIFFYGYFLNIGIKRNNSFFIIFFTYIRIIFVVLVAIIFADEFKNIVSYILGFLSHFIILSCFWFLKLKGSE